MTMYTKLDIITHRVATLIAAIILFSGCGQPSPTPEAIYTCDDYTVTADSVLCHNMHIGASGIAETSHEGTRLLTPSELLNRIYSAGAAAVTTDTVMDSPQALLDTWITLPAIDNDAACRKLMAMLGPDSLPSIESEGYTSPLTTSRALWAVAAWEAYCAGAPRTWLETACRITGRMLAADSAVAYRTDLDLMQGSILNPDRGHRVIYPRWMDAAARFESVCLANNAATVIALDAYSKMLAELGHDGSAPAARSREISEAVNTRLWVPDKGYYSQYLYGGRFPLQSQAADNFGQGLAILAGIPTPEMARSALSHTPMVSGGPSVTQPSAVGTPPYAVGESWPATQMLWTLAAAQTQDAAAFNFAATSLIYHAASTERETDMKAAAAMLLRGVAGITFCNDRLEFHPFVTQGFTTPIRIDSLRYRDATLSVAITGTGTRIARFAIDSVETAEYFVPAVLSGKHSVEITLANNTPAMRDIKVSRQSWLQPVPELVWKTPRRAEISDFTPGTQFKVYLNGVPYETTDRPTYTAPEIHAATIMAMTETDPKTPEGYSSKPRVMTPPGTLSTLQVEEFAEPGTTLVRERRLSRRFVESSQTAVRRIVLELPEPADGECLIDLCYANGNGAPADGNACAIRSLTVNSEPCGMFVLPARGDGWWLSTGQSNMLAARLHTGLNVIEITIPDCASDATALIDYLRVLRTTPMPGRGHQHHK